MTKEKFKILMQEAGYKKKNDLAKDLGLAYGTINAWGNTKEFPNYIENFLYKAIRAKKYERLRETKQTILEVHIHSVHFCEPIVLCLWCRQCVVLEKQIELFKKIDWVNDWGENLYKKGFYTYEILPLSNGVQLSSGEAIGIMQQESSIVDFYLTAARIESHL